MANYTEPVKFTETNCYGCTLNERTFNRPNKKIKPHPKAVAKLTKLWEDNI